MAWRPGVKLVSHAEEQILYATYYSEIAARREFLTEGTKILKVGVGYHKGQKIAARIWEELEELDQGGVQVGFVELRMPRNSCWQTIRMI
jgi:hypothetical protein